MSKMKDGNCVVSCEVSIQIRDALDAYASANNIMKEGSKPNRSEVVRRALAEFVERNPPHQSEAVPSQSSTLSEKGDGKDESVQQG